MAEITISGIDRSGTHENAVPNAATLILNARKKGKKWEHVGDKVYLGHISESPNTNNDPDYIHCYWHYKYGEDTVIVYNKRNGGIDAKTITDGCYKASFRDANNNNLFFIPKGEALLSIHSLNDFVVIDTDKNKYFFVWEEDLSTFCRLPDLPDLKYNVSYTKKKVKYHYTATDGVFAKETSLYITDDCLLELIRVFSNKVKSLLIDANNIFPSFKFILAYELTDGSIIGISDIGNYVKRFPYHTVEEDFSVVCYDILSGNLADNTRIVYFRCTSIDNTGIRKYRSPSGSSVLWSEVNSVSLTDMETYAGFDIILSNNNIYKDLQKWVDAGILKSISVYMTAPNDYIDYNRPPIKNVLGIYTNDKGHQLYYFPYNNELAEGLSEPFYKVGEFDLVKKETKFSLKPEMQKNMEAGGAIKIEQDLSRILVSRENNLYNGMLHKYAPTSIIKNNLLVLNEKIFDAAVDAKNNRCYLDLKINNKWIRIGIENLSMFVANNLIAKVQSPNKFIINSNSVQDANIVGFIDYSGEFYIYCKLLIDKNNFLNLSILTNILLQNPKRIRTFYDTNTYNTFTEEVYLLNGGDKGINVVFDTSSIEKVNYSLSKNANHFTDRNRMQLSATDNPFVYPAARSYRFNDESNKVIKAETASVELSVYKFGTLPMYVFTTQGVWIMEVGSGDIAYASQHLLENVHCIDNPNFIKRVLGGVIFCTKNGISFVSNGQIQKIPCAVEGRVLLEYIGNDSGIPIGGIEADLGFLIGGATRKIDNIVTDYFTEKSFSAYDSYHNEILFIEPSKDFIIVLSLSDFTYSFRIDILFQSYNYVETRISRFSKLISINNNDVLISNYNDKYVFNAMFYSLDEQKYVKRSNKYYPANSLVLFATTTLFSPNYMKVEHLIARFFQNATQALKSSIYLYVFGSRDGIEWRIVARGKIENIEKPMQGLQIRRCFTSCRYFQFVFAKKDTTRNDEAGDRLGNNFSGFCFDWLMCDNPKKLR